jgi:serine-type D-Ala-D-Ala carboxypeptidase/endopeptidase (penicillin-binding protein 4)
MRSLAALLLVMLSPLAASADEPSSPLDWLQERLAAQVRGCRSCRWGVLVKEHEGRVVFSRSASLPFNPASNLKLFTTAAALTGMGKEHRFATRLFGRREGVRVVGGLYLEGEGDPTLTTTAMAEMAARLHKLGVREVDGPLYLDTTSFKDRGDPPGFSRFRSSHPFRAGVDALSLNRNVIRIEVIPAEQAGELATVTLSPRSAYLTLRARVRTARRTWLWASTSSTLSGTRALASGRIRVGSAPRSYWRRVFHPAMYTGHTLLAALAEHGITVGAVVRRRAVPPDTPLLVEHRSEPLAVIINQGNKESSNVMAELLVLALGAHVFGRPATFEKGRRAVEQYLRGLGVKPGAFRMQNASGLSRLSSIRPMDFVRILELLHDDREIGAEMIASLPVAGQDGTLRKRFAGSPAAGHVHAKTGTLSGISCLSGLAEVRGKQLFFSFLTARVRRMRSVRRLHVAMAETLVEYLRRVAPGASSTPASTPASAPVVKPRLAPSRPSAPGG